MKFRLFIVGGIFVALTSPAAATPTARFSVTGPSLKVRTNVLDVQSTAAQALRKAGCDVVEGEPSDETFRATVEASITEKAPAICTYSVSVTDSKLALVYSTPRTAEDAICSLPWMKGEIERQMKVACDVATGVVTRRMLEASTKVDVEPNPPPPVVAAPLPPQDEPADKSHVKAYTGWTLVGVGALVAIFGGQLWAADGANLDREHKANTTGGPALLAVGVASMAVGGLLVGGVF